MLRFLADEDFNRAIVRGVLRVAPEVDIVRVQDVGLRTQQDEVVLEWAARNDRVLLTHDARTMPVQAYQRLGDGLPMAGLFVVQQDASLRQIIEDLVLLAEVSLEQEWSGQVVYLPL